MHFDYDVIIVGAGIAGASAAICLAEKDYRVLLLDRAVFPRDKPCGEGIMPQGVAILESLGVLAEIRAQGGVEFRGMRFRNLKGVWAEADFPESAGAKTYGVVMRRFQLDDILLQRAKSYPNVQVREGFEVVEVLQQNGVVQGVSGKPAHQKNGAETFRAPLTIGADGIHSLFHAQCDLKKTYLRRRRFGITGHLKGVRGLSSYVDVLVHPDGEIYVAPCSEDVTLVALLLEERAMKFFAGNLANGYMEFLRHADGMSDRILQCELIPPVFAVGPLGFTVEPCCRSGLLLIGDSAGFLDPITGEGMTLALKSVQVAISIIEEAFSKGDFGEGILGRYAAERIRLVEDLFRFTKLLLDLYRFKPIANHLIHRLSKDPSLLQKLLGIVTGNNRYRDLTLAEKWSLVWG